MIINVLIMLTQNIISLIFIENIYFYLLVLSQRFIFRFTFFLEVFVYYILFHLFCQPTSSMDMTDCMFVSIPKQKSSELFKFLWPFHNALSGCSSKGIFYKTKSFLIRLCNFIIKSFFVKNNIKVVTFPGNMNLVVPKDKRNERNTIELRVVFY